MSVAGCDWGCCVQADGETALMVACESWRLDGHTDIVTLLLAVPGLDVNAANVSCVYYYGVSQDGWVMRSKVSLEVHRVGCGLTNPVAECRRKDPLR